MNSDEEDAPKGNRLFNINLVNSYGNSTLTQPSEVAFIREFLFHSNSLIF